MSARPPDREPNLKLENLDGPRPKAGDCEMPNTAKNEYGITRKQEAFVQKLMECGNQSEAYRHAYDVGEGTSANTVQTEAWKLMQNPDISHRFKSLQEDVAAKFLYNIANAHDELEEARIKAMNERAPAAAVAAIRGKIKLFGLGAENIKIEATVREEFLSEEEQLERIKKLIPQLAPLLIELGWTPPFEGA